MSAASSILRVYHINSDGDLSSDDDDAEWFVQQFGTADDTTTSSISQQSNLSGTGDLQRRSEDFDIKFNRVRERVIAALETVVDDAIHNEEQPFRFLNTSQRPLFPGDVIIWEPQMPDPDAGFVAASVPAPVPLKATLNTRQVAKRKRRKWKKNSKKHQSHR